MPKAVPAKARSKNVASPKKGETKVAPTARKGKDPKTKVTAQTVAAFLETLEAAARADCERIAGWMRAATKAEGVMYGAAIVGFGSSVVRYADGRESPWMKMGFSPRKHALTLYGVLSGASPALRDALGKHDTGKGCLYIKRLADVDAGVLEKIIRAAART